MKTIDKTNEHIIKTVAEIFSEKGFENLNGLGNLSKVFFTNSEIETIFFSTNLKDLLTKNAIQIHLAVFTPKVNNATIEKMKQVAKSLVSNIDQFAIGTYAGKDHTHIAIYTNNDFLGRDDKFDVKFRELLNESFFKKDGIVDQIKLLEP